MHKTAKPSNIYELRTLTRGFSDVHVPDIPLRSESTHSYGPSCFYFNDKNDAVRSENGKRIMRTVSDVLWFFTRVTGRRDELPIISVNPGLRPSQGFMHYSQVFVNGAMGIRPKNVIELGPGAEPQTIAHETMHYARSARGVFLSNNHKSDSAAPKIEEACGLIAEAVPALVREPGPRLFQEISRSPQLVLVHDIFTKSYRNSRPPGSNGIGWPNAKEACKDDIDNLHTISKIKTYPELKRALDGHAFKRSSPIFEEKVLALTLFINNRFDADATIKAALTLGINELCKKLEPDPSAFKSGIGRVEECLLYALKEAWPEQK